MISEEGYIFFSHYNNVTSIGKQSFVEAEKFFNQAFDSISSYGVSRFLGYGYSQSFNPLVVMTCYRGKISRSLPNPLLVNGSEPACLNYPFQFPVRFFFHAYRPAIPIIGTKSLIYTVKS